MARRLDRFDFRSTVPSGRPARYPWSAWTDGSIWHVTRGADYDVATRRLQATLHAYAGRQHLGLRTRQGARTAAKAWCSASPPARRPTTMRSAAIGGDVSRP